MEECFNVADIYGEDVFSDSVMRDRLPNNVYRELHKAMDEGGELNPLVADEIAEAMKQWAIEKGATHYTHWFQPLTGTTAEKHDSFLASTGEDGRVLMELSGRNLIKGESDASSFPSGGLRATFEARGYTAWDMTSPAFVRRDAAGATLCIPTAFCSYNGEALDFKTPLLRSMDAINRQSLRLLRLFGNTTSKKVRPYVGPEQEYFLVDKTTFHKRRDLVYTGRTLFGAMPPKGQELDDHYYGSLRTRVASFMKDVNQQLWRLGVPAKTQHNEVAPAQHELAVIYENASLAVDNNHLVMQTLKRVASWHNMRCLLHEKPFAGVNGSGKHNNWSLQTDDGINLLDPGKTPHENDQFLLVLSCILKAVDEHADLLRESAADPGNDHRLGANEAPPAVISVFLGDQLEDLVMQLIRTGAATRSIRGGKLVTGASTLPDFSKDATDRNRTSPFAFTGNKFEFRMVGSKDSIAAPNIVLDTIVAEAFSDACDELEKAEDFDRALQELIRRYLTQHQRIIFNGNGYSEDWVKEAEQRGLPNLPSMVDAIPALVTDRSVSMFEKFGVFSRSELESRVEIKYENYANIIHIEAMTMVDMASKSIIPAIVHWTGSLAGTIRDLESIGADTKVHRQLLDESGTLLTQTSEALQELIRLIRSEEKMPEGRKKAVFCHREICPAMETLRRPVDRLEMIVDKEMWPMPSYGDLLFEL